MLEKREAMPLKTAENSEKAFIFRPLEMPSRGSPGDQAPPPLRSDPRRDRLVLREFDGGAQLDFARKEGYELIQEILQEAGGSRSPRG
jgi:hypothetical protein